MAKGEENLLKGDKLRDLMLLVYLNNKYGLGTTIRIRKLKDFLEYSTGGIYGALDESGFFIRNQDDLRLSEKGERYVKKEILTYYRAFNPIGYLLVFLGIVVLFQSYLRIYLSIIMTFDWSVGLSWIVVGLVIRFGLLPFVYWITKATKKI